MSSPIGVSIRNTSLAYLEVVRRDSLLRGVLLILVSLDLLFVAGHLGIGFAKLFGSTYDPIYAELNNPASLASTWNYGKYILLSGALILVFARTRQPAILAMAGVFALLLIDDFFELHDTLSIALGRQLNMGVLEQLKIQDQGELIVYLGMVLVFAPMLWIANATAKQSERQIVNALTLGILVLAFFGIAVDVAHGLVSSSVIPLGNIGDELAGTLEDGGEMLALSLCLWIGFTPLGAEPSGGTVSAA